MSDAHAVQTLRECSNRFLSRNDEHSIGHRIQYSCTVVAGVYGPAEIDRLQLPPEYSPGLVIRGQTGGGGVILDGRLEVTGPWTNGPVAGSFAAPLPAGAPSRITQAFWTRSPTVETDEDFATKCIASNNSKFDNA